MAEGVDPLGALWFGGTNSDQAAAIASDGTTTVVGEFFSDSISLTVSSSPQTLTTVGTTPLDIDCIVYAVDLSSSSISIVWVVTIGSLYQDRAYAIAIDASTATAVVVGKFGANVTTTLQSGANITLVSNDVQPNTPHNGDHLVFGAQIYHLNWVSLRQTCYPCLSLR